jgi:ATP-dependent Lhr-like helicase
MSSLPPKKETTSLPACASDGRGSFDRLHPEIRRWIWEQRWDELRDIQDRAIPAILDSSGDVLIAASTAAGKTEAAFLPILTAIADRTEKSLSVLYVGPLKALINDQFGRLDLLCERMEIPVVRWHGDAPQAAKAKTLKNPRGIALITPESIEALFIRRPGEVRGLLGALNFIVIDELHAFLKGPRGLHVASLLRRIDMLSDKRPRRVGLSATLGDLGMAGRWLNPEAPQTVNILKSDADSPEIRLQIRAYVEPADAEHNESESEDGKPGALDLITDHLFANLRGSNNLVFATSRREVELIADRLRLRCERESVPNEFFPHHGNLSKELRGDLENRLKRGDLPTTGVATTTLELGIDIGSVKSVAQIGAPRSLASLRQRLGRSGRRKGMPATLRIYVREGKPPHDADPLEWLRLELVQSVAAVRLLLKGFVEPASLDPSIATVVLHQILSVVTERGGMRADRLHHTICGAGPLDAFGKAEFVELLRAMASVESKMIEQAPDGAIMLGEAGERLTAGRDFYAIFETDEEWRLVSGGRTLGTIPIKNSVDVGSILIFAGQRWRIAAVDDKGKVLEVVIHRAGMIPGFSSLGGDEPIHDRLVAEMLALYRDTDVPPYLDGTAKALLEEGRAAFRQLKLDSTRLIQSGGDTHVMLWRGTSINDLFAIAMKACGLDSLTHDVGITVADATADEVYAVVRRMADTPPVPIDDLAAFVQTLRSAKYDGYVPETLLRRLWARRHATEAAELQSIARSIADTSLH